MFRPPQRVDAVGSQRNVLSGAGRGASNRPFDAHRPPLKDSLIADFNEITRETGVGAHWATILRRRLPVLDHRLEHERREASLFKVNHRFNPSAVILWDIDGSLNHYFVSSLFDCCVFYHARVPDITLRQPLEHRPRPRLKTRPV